MKYFSLRSTCMLFTAMALSISGNIFADDHEGPANGVAETWIVTVDMASQPAFEEAFKSHIAVRAEAGDPASWQVYVSNTGDNTNTYYIRNCCFQWDERDAYDAWGEENAEVQADWGNNVHPHVSNYGHHFSLVDFANSNWPAGTEHKFVGVTTYDISSGSGQAFDAAKAELSQAAKTGGWADDNAWAWSSSISGEQSVSLAIPHENYADMAPPDPTFFQYLAEHLDSEEAAQEAFERFSSTVDSTSYKIYTHRPDMSME